MKCICNYNPRTDLRDVDNGAIIDINDILRTGVVPSTINFAPMSFNGIDEPSSIIGSPRDTFDAYRLHEQIMSAEKADAQ